MSAPALVRDTVSERRDVGGGRWIKRRSKQLAATPDSYLDAAKLARLCPDQGVAEATSPLDDFENLAGSLWQSPGQRCFSLTPKPWQVDAFACRQQRELAALQHFILQRRCDPAEASARENCGSRKTRRRVEQNARRVALCAQTLSRIYVLVKKRLARRE